MDRLIAEFGTGQVLWSMVWFVLFFIWIWLVVVVFGDIFRSRDLTGWVKAVWTILVVVLPYLGVFVYLIARGTRMHERVAQQAQEQDMGDYVHGVVGPGMSPADEIARLAELRGKGVINEAEFKTGKAKALS
jgi:hypothetical protein